MKRKKKYLIIVMLIATLILIIKPNNAQAALQANGGTVKADTINNWMSNIRQMQASGGTLGLTDTINTNLTSSNTNLDIHMEKNTEYGAMAILSASAYGNPNTIVTGETTTGNATGIVINLNSEWTSTGCEVLGNFVANFKNALGRYKNIYTTTYNAKVGDAIGETTGWHSSGASDWIIGDGSGLFRSVSGSVFSYYGRGGAADYNRFGAGRAVVVVGAGV